MCRSCMPDCLLAKVLRFFYNYLCLKTSPISRTDFTILLLTKGYVLNGMTRFCLKIITFAGNDINCSTKFLDILSNNS